MLTVEDLERAMIEEYRKLTRAQFCKDTSEGELLLFQFQGTNDNCGKSGDRANKIQMEAIPTRSTRKKVTVVVDFKENLEHVE
jgi:hypothetical protein